MPETGTSLLKVIGYRALPVVSPSTGGAITAGFVFAAAGVDVLPDVMHRALPPVAALGFTVASP